MIGIGGMLIRLYLLVVTIDGQSMAPALESGDRVLVLRIHSSAWIQKGCIVLIDAASTEESIPKLVRFPTTKPVIKRVVALGGERFIISSTPQEDGERRPLERRVWDIPQGHIFVCGDNYKQSVDSRLWGPLPYHRVLGVMLMKLPHKASSERLWQLAPLSRELPLGERAPAFSVPTVSGEIVTLHTYHGQDLLLLFITHTELSHRNMPSFLDLVPRAAAAGISIVFVSMSSAHKIRPFVEEWHITLPVLVAPRDRNPLLDDYAVPGAPFYCFIDASGKVQASGRASPQFFTEIETLRQHRDLPRDILLSNPNAPQGDEEARQNRHQPLEC